MLADTAQLLVKLNYQSGIASGVAKDKAALGGLSRSTGQITQGFKTMGAGIGVALRNVAILGVAAAGGLVAGLIKSAKEGQAAANVQKIYAQSIANSGKISTQYVSILNAQQTALMNLGGVDDELIKTEQTRLIQMGLNGAQVAKLTPLILDLSKATGKDLITSTVAVGKAVNGSTGGLIRFGVVIDKAKAKADPFGATLDALNSKFKGTTQALSGSLDTRLAALRENLQNVREEAGIKLLPVLTRIVDVVGTKLVPAFGKFLDRILPSVISGLDKFASMLDNGGAERGIKAITDALGPMVDLLKIAAAPVKAIVSAFLSLPSQVQGVLIGAFAVNKLSGGLIGAGAGQVVKGALGGVLGGLLQRGGTPANPLFVSDVTGGLGGAAGLAGAAGGVGLGTIAASLIVPTVLAMAAEGAFDSAATKARERARITQGGLTFYGGRAGGTFGGTSATSYSPTVGNLGRGPMPLTAIPLTAIQVTNAVAAGTEKGLIHSGVFGKAAAVREAGGFRLSRDAVISMLHSKGALGTDALVTGQAIALAVGNHLRTDLKPDLKSANSNLALLKRLQAHLPTDLAAKLEPKIHSLELTIQATTRAVDRTTAAVKAIRVGQLAVGKGPTEFDQGPTGSKKPGPAGSKISTQTGFTLTSYATVSTRDVNIGQTTRYRNGPTPDQTGAI